MISVAKNLVCGIVYGNVVSKLYDELNGMNYSRSLNSEVRDLYTELYLK